jgi:hypothetical protein
VQCTNVEMAVHQGLQSFSLHGKMACQTPRNFNLVALAPLSNKQEVLIGSNADEFWFWAAKAEPYLFHCSYGDLNEGKCRLPIPIQPDWLLEAMGAAPCAPADQYELKVRDKTYELILNAKSPRGEPIRKIIVMNQRPTQAPEPQVIAHIIQNERGVDLCKAEIKRVQFVNGALIPYEMKLTSSLTDKPADKFEMTLTLRDPRVNDPALIQDQERQAKLFTRPSLQDIQPFDLAMRPDMQPNGVRRVGAQQPIR